MKKLLIALLSLTTVVACSKRPSDPSDPLETYNRAMFAVNEDVDHLVIRPAAKVYNAITPPPVQTGVTNFFDNIFELTTFPNDFLQGNFKFMAVDFWRFFLNSTLGVGGLFDVASHVGLPQHTESFGLTLAKWRGGKSAPYFMLPILGPSTFQSAVGLGVDYFATPWPYIDNNAIAYGLPALGMVNYRARLLSADKLVETSFDPYVFVRNAYLQRQSQQIAENQAQGDNTRYKKNEALPENTVGGAL